MAEKSGIPNSISQTSGGNFSKFKNLNNLKDRRLETFAESTVGMKTEVENRPSTLTLTNFKMDLPSNAKITSISVHIEHYKTAESAGKYPGISAPKITLLNIDNASGKGRAPTSSRSLSVNLFKVSPKVADVNSSNFGVKIDYPANSNKNEGSICISHVSITVQYTTPSYSLSIKSLAKNYIVDSIVGFRVTINNLKKLDHNPSIIITIPSTTQLSSHSGGLSKISNTQYLWNAKLSKKVASSTTDIYLKLNSAGNNQTLTVKEQVNNASKSFTFNIKPKSSVVSTIEVPAEETPTEVISDDSDYVAPEVTVLTFVKNQPSPLNIALSEEVYDKLPAEVSHDGTNGLYISCEGNLKVLSEDSYYNTYNAGQSDFDENRSKTFTFKASECGVYALDIYYPSTIVAGGASIPIQLRFKQYKINVVPPLGELTRPVFSIFPVKDEELDRLGHPIVYTVQSWVKLITNELLVRDWGKNFRLGVFNNAISSNVVVNTITDENDEIIENITDTTDYATLTANEIYDNAAYWSETPQEVNTFENMELEFPYNENYPLYIIFTGDYLEGNSIDSTLQYSSPCLVESEVYRGYEPVGNYPVPINSTIRADEDFAELVLPALQEGNKIVVYDIDVDDEFGTDENWAVKGIRLTADVEYYDDVIVYAQLQHRINNELKLGNRSIILDTSKEINEISIGADNDTWGLKISELKNLKDLEIELYVANLLNEESNATITFNNIQLNFTLQPLKKYITDMWVNGEDVRYYGMFVRNVKFKKGLETDVKYIEVEGSDNNEAYNQTIDVKEIEIEFRVLGCDINETTKMMQDIARLFTNDRDELNRPIPNRLDMSMLPNDHFEFIMKDAIEDEIDSANYEGKIKLVVPKGTAIANEDTVTSNYGHVFSIAKVNPVIRCKSCDSRVEVVEEYSNQKFIIDLSELEVVNDAGNTLKSITPSDILEIDCVNQKVYLINQNEEIADVTAYADMHTDWFILSKGEYYFNSSSCIIQTVTTTERS